MDETVVDGVFAEQSPGFLPLQSILMVNWWFFSTSLISFFCLWKDETVRFFAVFAPKWYWKLEVHSSVRLRVFLFWFNWEKRGVGSQNLIREKLLIWFSCPKRYILVCNLIRLSHYGIAGQSSKIREKPLLIWRVSLYLYICPLSLNCYSKSI